LKDLKEFGGLTKR